MSHHLIAAADAQERFSVLNRTSDLVRLAGLQIAQQNFLFKILSASDEKQIVRGQIPVLPDFQLVHMRFNAAPFQTLFHTADIAAVTIQIQYLRIEVADVQFHN